MEDFLSKIKAKNVYKNAETKFLINEALRRKEGELTSTGALLVKTGKYTGRSPKDKYIVFENVTGENINWGNINVKTTREIFNIIRDQIIEYLSNKDIYVFDGYAGADKKHQRKFRIINELASQNLFIRNLLVRPSEDELKNYGEPDWTILAAPGVKVDYKKLGLNSEAAIMIDYEMHTCIIAGSGYAGEIKKSIFSIMNYVMPVEDKVLPMHCSANMDPVTKETAVFFGLSGTGKTTLSADPNRKLIGDDEHGWADEGIFNFEGGCYAKCIDLKEENEPEIFQAIREGALVENVIMDPVTKICDYSDKTLTENTRVGYPVEFISNSQIPGVGGIPKVVIFLTADAFGVLPPISRLDKNAAMYHFVTGFTSKLAGTERGVTEPQPTFSTLFGEPFMPLPAEKYAKMLGERLDRYNTKVYLVNTGWTGGPYGVGSRMKLKYTRAMITAALNGSIEKTEFTHDKLFNLDIPKEVKDCPSEILKPRDTWNDKNAYDNDAKKLAKMFIDNFEKKYPNMDKKIKEAGPNLG